MKSTIRNFLIVCSAILFLLSMVAEGLSASPGHSRKKPHPEKRNVFQAPPKYQSQVQQRRKYVVAKPAYRTPHRGPEHRWVPRYRHPSGVYFGGYWRPSSKPGFIWVDGFSNTVGVWVSGYWKPLCERPGYRWIPGYRNKRVWVDGYWRQTRKHGPAWVPGYYNRNGMVIKGHWK